MQWALLRSFLEARCFHSGSATQPGDPLGNSAAETEFNFGSQERIASSQTTVALMTTGFSYSTWSISTFTR